MELIDIGVNLTNGRFRKDREAVLERARAAGVCGMVLTGTDLDASAASADMAAEHPRTLWSTAGVHPHNASDWNAASPATLTGLAARDAVVAIGETGLDFNRNFSPPADQERAFEAQLELACELGLPVFLHQRDAHRRFLQILGRYRDRLVAAVAHCFTGGREELRPYLELDLHVGVTGWICDPRRGGELRACVAEIPEHRLMVETDAPFLLPRDLDPAPRDRRNEPAFLPHVLEAVARLRGDDPHHLAAVTTANARRFFAIDPTGCTR